MSRRTLLLLFSTVLVVACTGGAVARWKAAHLPASSQPIPLIVDPKSLDFGEVWETDRLVLEIPVTNPTDQQIALTDLGGSCNCGMVEPTALTLPPSSTQTVRLTLDLRPKSCEVFAAPLRTFETQWRASAKIGDGTAKSVAWSVHGRVKQPLKVGPIAFGRCSELARPIAPLVVPLESQVALESLTVDRGTPDFQAAIRPLPTSPSRYELVVTPVPTVERGAHVGKLTLIAVAAGGMALPKVTVSASIEIVPDIETTPDRLLIGARDRGTEVTEIVSLRSLSGRSFVVEHLEAEGPGVTATAGTDGRSCAIQVRIADVGPLSGQVRLRVRPKGADPVELIIPVRGHGFSPGQ